jgi:hypothetical protein
MALLPRERGRPPGSRRLLRLAALYHHICSMLENNVNQEKGDRLETASGLPCLGMNSSFKQYSKVGYEDAKAWKERRLAGVKSGIPNWATTAMATEWRDHLDTTLMDLDLRVMEIEAANLMEHYKRWHVPRLGLGNIPAQHPDGVFWSMGGKLNSASSTEIHLRKVADMVSVLNDWEVQGGCLSEVGVNWSARPPSANLASWFRDEIPNMCTHTAHNGHEVVGSHQPGGTGSFFCGELVRYMK